MIKNANKRNCAIDLLRIIACFFVIIAHIQLGFRVNGKINYGIFGVQAIVADNVPLFFLITGYFFFRSSQKKVSYWDAYRSKIAKFLTNLWIPSILAGIMACILVAHKNNSSVQWSLIIDYLFKIKATGIVGSYWYLCTYFRFVIFFPLIAAICEDSKEKNRIRRFLMALSFLMVVSEDLEYVFKTDFLDFSPISFGYHLLYLLVGFELSIWIPKLKKNCTKLRWGSLGIYLLSIVLKAVFQLLIFRKYGMEEATRFFWLQNTLCYVSSASLFCFSLSLEEVFKDEKLKRVIRFLGTKTFYVYLSHATVLVLSDNIKQKLIAYNYGYQSVLGSILYYMEYAGFVFVVGILFAVLFDAFYDKMVKRVVNAAYLKALHRNNLKS